MELMQEFHENPEIAEMFGLKETVLDNDYMNKFN